MQNGRGRGPLQYPGNLGAQLGFGQGRWIQVELLIVSGTVFDNGLEDNVAEQEGVTGQIRTSAHVRSRFLPSAHFSEMGNRSRTSRPRKWVGGSSNDSVFQNYNVEKTPLRPHPRGPHCPGRKADVLPNQVCASRSQNSFPCNHACFSVTFVANFLESCCLFK